MSFLFLSVKMKKQTSMISVTLSTLKFHDSMAKVNLNSRLPLFAPHNLLLESPVGHECQPVGLGEQTAHVKILRSLKERKKMAAR